MMLCTSLSLLAVHAWLSRLAGRCCVVDTCGQLLPGNAPRPREGHSMDASALSAPRSAVNKLPQPRTACEPETWSTSVQRLIESVFCACRDSSGRLPAAGRRRPTTSPLRPHTATAVRPEGVAHRDRGRHKLPECTAASPCSSRTGHMHTGDMCWVAQPRRPSLAPTRHAAPPARQSAGAQLQMHRSLHCAAQPREGLCKVGSARERARPCTRLHTERRRQPRPAWQYRG